MSTRGDTARGVERGGYPAAILHAVRHRWLLVVCTALVVIALAVAAGALRGSGYTAESLVQVQGFGGAGAEELSAQRIEEIRLTAGPEKVSRSAMRSIGWEAGIEEFERSLDVEAAGDGRLDVAFSAGDPDTAAEGANAYAESFVERVERLDESRLAGGSLNAGAEVARRARPPASPDVGLAVVGLVAVIPGLGAGSLLALVLGSRDQRWRDARDAEITLGAPVLGVIPEYGGCDPAELDTVADGASGDA